MRAYARVLGLDPTYVATVRRAALVAQAVGLRPQLARKAKQLAQIQRLDESLWSLYVDRMLAEGWTVRTAAAKVAETLAAARQHAAAVSEASAAQLRELIPASGVHPEPLQSEIASPSPEESAGETTAEQGSTPALIASPPVVNQRRPCRLGDLYGLGPHRVMCGDSTDSHDVKCLMGGKLADCMCIDPPYGNDYEGKTKDRLKMANVDREGLESLLLAAFANADRFALARGVPIYM